MMAKSKKPRKPYRPRDVRTPMLVGTDLVLRPLEAIIEQIDRDGTVNASRRGVPIFQRRASMKYEFVDGDTKEVDGRTLRRIRAVVAVGMLVAPGDLGGYIETEKNLSMSGNAWVYGNARVYGNA